MSFEDFDAIVNGFRCRESTSDDNNINNNKDNNNKSEQKIFCSYSAAFMSRFPFFVDDNWSKCPRKSTWTVIDEPVDCNWHSFATMAPSKTILVSLCFGISVVSLLYLLLFSVSVYVFVWLCLVSHPSEFFCAFVFLSTLTFPSHAFPMLYCSVFYSFSSYVCYSLSLLIYESILL